MARSNTEKHVFESMNPFKRLMAILGQVMSTSQGLYLHRQNNTVGSEPMKSAQAGKTHSLHYAATVMSRMSHYCKFTLITREYSEQQTILA
jgi:hypothetical protein